MHQNRTILQVPASEIHEWLNTTNIHSFDTNSSGNIPRSSSLVRNMAHCHPQKNTSIIHPHSSTRRHHTRNRRIKGLGSCGSECQNSMTHIASYSALTGSTRALLHSVSPCLTATPSPYCCHPPLFDSGKVRSCPLTYTTAHITYYAPLPSTASTPRKLHKHSPYNVCATER